MKRQMAALFGQRPLKSIMCNGLFNARLLTRSKRGSAARLTIADGPNIAGPSHVHRNKNHNALNAHEIPKPYKPYYSISDYPAFIKKLEDQIIELGKSQGHTNHIKHLGLQIIDLKKMASNLGSGK